MYTGFYRERDVLRQESNDNSIDFEFMENYDGIDLYLYLHGICYVFALYLHNKYGYPIVCFYDDIGLIHVFCKKQINGKDYYIDIRGITDDAEEFFDEFSDWMDYQNLDDSIIIKEFNNSEDYLSFLKRFVSTIECKSPKRMLEIEQVISDNPSYYSFNNLKY